MPKVRKEATVTSKGQITVPLSIRQLLGIKAGDKLVFEADGTKVSVGPIRTGDPFAKYQGINPDLPRNRRDMLRYMRELRGR